MSIAAQDYSERTQGQLQKKLDQQQLLQLVHSLHASLDIQQITEQFLKGLTQMISCDGLHYRNNELNLETKFGTLSSHRVHYQLRSHNHYLGEIEFCRTKPFASSEVIQIEELLCFLINPIANAIEYQKALQSALRDPLTGLPNRTSLNTTLNREFELAKRHHRTLSVLALDIDHFKQINDECGHLAGDHYLKEFSLKLMENCRDTDLLYRIGGEEFLIILSNTDQDGATQLADRISKSIRGLLVTYKNKILRTSVSIGVVHYENEDKVEQLLEEADEALYTAKRRGRDQFAVFARAKRQLVVHG